MRVTVVLVALYALLCASLGEARAAPLVKRVSSSRHPATVLQGHAGSHRDGKAMKTVNLSYQSHASDCAQLCVSTTGCQAWSFGDDQCDIKYPSTACTLMSTVGKVSGHACRTSGAPSMSLLAPAYPRLPLSAVQPLGWLKRELELQNTGLAGHLQLFWDDVADSEFIGGHHDTTATNHERFVYWLNGQVSMGYLTQDKAMARTIQNYTNYLLKNQSADGFLGPRQNFDPWPRMMILYAFQQYHEIYPDDARVIPAMFSYLRFLWNQYTAKGYNPQDYMWTYVRIEDMQTSIEWLYDHYGAQYNQTQFLLDLNEILYVNSWDWKNYYRNRFPTGDIGHSWNYYDHGVNNGQALKSAAVWYRQSQDYDDVRNTYERMEKMDRFHGQASGIFSCDECLAGLNPSRGTELCTVVEAMFSYEMIYSIIGDNVFADKVEQMAFNALPGTMTPDLWAHQYLQQSNEINSVRQADPWWNTDGGDSNLYGLAPNYGCCTANHPQGWPKYVASQWLMTQNVTNTGIHAALLGPSQLSVTVEDPTYGTNSISVTQDTEYPLKANPDIQFTINAEHPFAFSVRIPGWAVGATVTLDTGKVVSAVNGTNFVYDYEPGSKRATAKIITVHLVSTLRSTRRYNDAISIYYGPLLMALDFSYNTTVLAHYVFNSSDYQYLPIDKWNYAIQVDESSLASSFNVSEQAMGPYPFDPLRPTITLTAYAREIDWPMKHDSADVPPQSPVKSSAPLTPITLIPYGATILRIAEIPMVAN